MGLRRTRPQQVTSDEGWQVEGAGREAVRYREAGREALVGVDRGQPTRLYADDLAWVRPGGQRTPLADAERALVLRRLVEGLEAMGVSVELHPLRG